MENNFQTGDTVCLKSNPDVGMTVDVCHNDSVITVWLSNDNTIQRMEFNKAMLQYYLI